MLDVAEPSQSRCPSGQVAQPTVSASGRVTLAVLTVVCGSCACAAACPAQASKRQPEVRQVRTTLEEWRCAQRRRYQTTAEFAKRQAWRAGIEATNSELKRGHGLGRLRVRGGERVKQAVYLKAAGCNVKRALVYLGRHAEQRGQFLHRLGELMPQRHRPARNLASGLM